MAELNISNIKNQINRIKNCVSDTYVALEDKDAILPATNNADNIASTIRNIPADTNKWLNIRSNNGKNYDYLYYGYTNDTFNLDDLDMANVISMEGFVKDANNLSYSFLNKLFKVLPSYNNVSNPYTQNLSYFGISQNVLDNHISFSASPSKDIWYRLRDMENKGWLIDNHQLVISLYTNEGNGSTLERIRYPDDITKIVKSNINSRRSYTSVFEIDFKRGIPEYLNIEGTSKIKDFSYMFNNCRPLTTIKNLCTANLVNGVSMFNYCQNLSSVGFVNNSTFSKLLNGAYMFNYANNMDLSNFSFNNLTSLENATYMFAAMKNMNSANALANIGNTTNLREAAYMFRYAYALNKIPANLVTNNLRNAYMMFYPSNSNLTGEINSNWNLNNLINGSYAFYTAKNVVINIDALPKALDVGSMFQNTTIKNDKIPSLPVVWNLYQTFSYTTLNQVNNQSFPNAYQMQYMFSYCDNLISAKDLAFNRSNTSQGVDYMFTNCTKMTDVANIFFNGTAISYSGMFSNCVNLRNISNITFKATSGDNFNNIFANDIRLTVNSLENIFGLLPSITTPREVLNLGIEQGQLSYMIGNTLSTNVQKAKNNNWIFPNIDNNLLNKYIFKVTTTTGTTSTINVQSIANKTNTDDVSKLEPINQEPVWLNANMRTYISNAKNIEITKYDERKTYLNSLFYNYPTLEKVTFNCNLPNRNYSVGYMFNNCQNLKTVNFLFENPYMNYAYIFSNCYNLTTVSHINGMYAYYMNNMCANCHNLTNTLNVDWYNLWCSDVYRDCWNLRNADVNLRAYSSYGPPLTAQNFFYNCQNLQNVSLNFCNNWNQASAQVNGMFEGCLNLTNVNIRYLYINKEVQNPFNYCNFYNASNMFKDCQHLPNIALPTISNYDEYKLTGNTAAMYQNCYNLKSVDKTFIMINSVDASNMFAAAGLRNIVGFFNMYTVQNASRMFEECTYLNSIAGIDTQNIRNGARMFRQCRNLTTIPDLNTQYLTGADLMFIGCNNLAAMPNMYVGNITNAAQMFKNCAKLTTIPTVDFKSAVNLSETFANTNLTEQSVWNIVNGLPNFNKLASGAVNDLTYLGFNTSNEKLYNAPWETTNSARAKGWNLYSRIFTNLQLTYVNGNIQNISIYGAKDKTINALERDVYFANISKSLIQDINIGTIGTNNFSSDIMSNFFSGCTNLTNIAFISASMYTNYSNTFRGCQKIENVDKALFISTNSAVAFQNAFRDCYNLKNINKIANVVISNAYYMCRNCRNLTDTPALRLNAATAVYMFANCTNLVNVNPFNVQNQNMNLYSAFLGCSKLSNASILNIVNSLPTITTNNTLATIGLTDSQVYNIPESVRQIARDKGWNVPQIEMI